MKTDFSSGKMAWALALLGLSFAVSCARPVGPEGGRQWIDELGRTVRIDAPPRRIVSLAPNVTEILFALGLGDRVVAVTSYCDYPEAARAKPKVGDTLHPDLERIVALQPDLAIITTSSQLQRLSQQLESAGIPVYVTNPRNVRGILASIRAIGEAVGARAQADELTGEMERRIAAVEARVRPLPRVRTLYVLQAAPLLTAGRNTFINDLIRLAGGESISGDEPVDYPQYSRETVLARAPAVIVAPGSHGTEFVKEDDLRRDFAETPAIRQHRIVRVNADWIDRPGPRIVEGLEQLAQGLHPESP